MSLNDELSEQSQNMIFARNGSGKSFIARSLRLLEKGPFSAPDDTDVANALISQESKNRTGFFKIYEGDKCIGSVDLDGKSGVVVKETSDYLYYIFSEDFIDDNVRNKLGSIDQEITHEIIVGGENAELDQLKGEVAKLLSGIQEDRGKIELDFTNAKEDFRKDLEINKGLSAFKNLTIEKFLSENAPNTEEDLKGLEDLKEQFNLYKSLPENPNVPTEVSIDSALPDIHALEASLSRETSPSSISSRLREKIENDPNFFERGLHLHENSDDETCPFCAQVLTDKAVHLINEYERFFKDEESKHRRELETHRRTLEKKLQELERLNKESLEAKVRFDKLKKYFPSMKEIDSADTTPFIKEISEHFKSIITTINQKLNDLHSEYKTPNMKNPDTQGSLADTLKSNAEIYDKLSRLTENSKEERIAIQKSACEAFLLELSKEKNAALEALNAKKSDYNSKKNRCVELEKSHGEKRAARDAVAETFKMLLQSFFGDKYSFDEESFSIKRKGLKIERGVDRSLSDGEKSVIGFCYFLAHIHLKVDAIEDYKRLFLIIDDPVSSLSFDYIHSIAHCLKRLRITDDGVIELSIAANLVRPKILILTHDNQFYNVSSSNNVVKSNGLFQLISKPEGHTLRNQKAIATPHMSQLRDVLQVSRGEMSPDHTTPNSIRSVIETMWRFCRPDLQDFEGFSLHLSSDHGLDIKTILLHENSHGGKFDTEAPLEEDVVRAAKEAIDVVRKFAPGQLRRV